MIKARVFRAEDGDLLVKLPLDSPLPEGEFSVEQVGDTLVLTPTEEWAWLDKVATGMDEDFRRYANEKPQWPSDSESGQG